jgi:mRNA interferase YafQ
MYRIVETSDFKKSYRQLLRSGKFKAKARAEFIRVLQAFREGKLLPAHNRDHALSGEWLGYRECHIKGDILLVYEKQAEIFVLVLIDIGSHSDLFG